jgi:mono/diheme cytochrome c family protein
MALTIARTAISFSVPARRPSRLNMLPNAFGLALNMGVAAILVWITTRAWRSKRALAKWLGAPVAALVAILFSFVGGTALKGMTYAYARLGRPVQQMTVDRTPERVARGEHIANALCAGCHSLNESIPLAGGKNFADDIPLPVGDIAPVNLTPAGPIKDWSDGQVFRAIREGVDPDGRRLVVMATLGVRNLSDDDIQSVIAYLRSQPAVSHETPRERLTYLAMIMSGAGLLPRAQGEPPVTVTAPPRERTAEYGEYIVKWVGCAECHGPALTGGKKGFGPPPGPNIHSVKGWTEAQFIQTIRTGVNPYGKKLDPNLMPWRTVSRLDDDELGAVHAYLTRLATP